MAFGVLIGALFLCVRPGGPAAHGSAAQATTADAHAVCVSPYDLPGCSPRTRVIPGVLPVPPPAVTAARPLAPALARPAGAGPVRAPGTSARAPDLHALQVLRT
jgi:hypothetical protein